MGKIPFDMNFEVFVWQFDTGARMSSLIQLFLIYIFILRCFVKSFRYVEHLEEDVPSSAQARGMAASPMKASAAWPCRCEPVTSP